MTTKDAAVWMPLRWRLMDSPSDQEGTVVVFATEMISQM